MVHSTKQLAHDENTGLVVMCNLHLTQYVLCLFNAWVTNAWHKVTQVNKFYMVASNICGSFVQNLRPFTLLTARILKWLLDLGNVLDHWYNELQRYTVCSVARFAAVDLYLQQVAFKASGIFCIRAASSYLIDTVIFTDDDSVFTINSFTLLRYFFVQLQNCNINNLL